jgi:hypothetical protein
MSTLGVTPQGLLTVEQSPSPQENFVVKAPLGMEWVLIANADGNGNLTAQDNASGPPDTLILYDVNGTPFAVTIDDGGILTVTSFDQNIVLAPVVNAPVLLNGVPAEGYQLLAFQGGTSIGVTTFKNGVFVTTQPTPILLNAFGLPTDPVFIIVGQEYKFQLIPPAGGLPVKEWDAVVGGIPLNIANALEWGPVFSAQFRTSTTAAIQADVRVFFATGRRLRATQTTIIYHTVKKATYDGTETLIEVEPGGTALEGALLTFEPSILSPLAGAVPDRRHLGTTTILNGPITIPSAQGLNVLPVGLIILGFASQIPPGWLWCNGQAVSRTTWANLFNSIHTIFGAGNGTTTFNVPNIPNVGTLAYLIYGQG